jgi:hypothetical protein
MHGTAAYFFGCTAMQYLIYFAVATPLLLGWLFYEAATLPPPAPLFASGYEHTSAVPAQQLAATPVANTAPKKFAKSGSATSE